MYFILFLLITLQTLYSCIVYSSRQYKLLYTSTGLAHMSANFFLPESPFRVSINWYTGLANMSATKNPESPFLVNIIWYTGLAKKSAKNTIPGAQEIFSAKLELDKTNW